MYETSDIVSYAIFVIFVFLNPIPMKKPPAGFPNPVLSVFSSVCLFAFFSCSKHAENNQYAGLTDTTVSVYGAYEVIKLPLTKGVKTANPVQLALGPGDYLFAANATGEIYTLRDTDGDGVEDTNLLYCDIRDYGLNLPGGFTSRGDTVFIGTRQEIRCFVDRDKDGKADTTWTFFNNIPHSEHPYEWTSGMVFGPDQWLYVAFTTDSWNPGASPDPNGYRGSIVRIAPGGKRAEVVATGIRSVYGMRFNDQGDLFFTDNAGGGNPKEELNLLVKDAFYGHNPKKFKRDSITAPVLTLETELAPAGIVFNKPENDFGGTGGDLFIAFYGPGERWTRGSVGRVRIKKQTDGNYSFEENTVADIPKLSNIAFGKDGSLYVSQHGKADYWYNAVYENEGSFYKILYRKDLAGKPLKARAVAAQNLSVSSVELGKQLFSERACLACHAVDGVTELLGPNLKDVSRQFSREEILQEIADPSARIKPSMNAIRVMKKDGKVLLGRVVNADENEISLMLVGNSVVQISRKDISKTEDEKKSLMYPNLLNGLTDEEKNALLDFLTSLAG